MKKYVALTDVERAEELKALQAQYEKAREKGYQLDMSRGKPAPVQLDLSMGLLEEAPETLVHSRKGADVRNYGELAGLD